MTSAIDHWSSDTSLYLQSGINVLSACHFTYSPKMQQEKNFRKPLIISYRVNALQLYFLEILYYFKQFWNNFKQFFHILLSYIVVSQKFKLNLISAKFLLSMISCNELSITLSTLYVLTFFDSLFVLFQSCCSSAWVIEKTLCMTSQFHTAILNGTSFFLSLVQEKLNMPSWHYYRHRSWSGR